MKNPVVVVVLTSLTAAICRAAGPAPLPERLVACAKIKDAGERVNCYDTEIAALTHVTATIPAPVTSAPPQSPQLLQPPAEFGEEQLPIKARATPSHKDDALLSSITELQTIGQKIYLITLANGQVWRQQGSQLPALFRVGNEVRIERGALGSYHLSTVAFGEKNWVLVTRTR